MRQRVSYDRRGFSPSLALSVDGGGIVNADGVWLAGARRIGTITCTVGCIVHLVRSCVRARAIGPPDSTAFSLAIIVSDGDR